MQYIAYFVFAFCSASFIYPGTPSQNKTGVPSVQSLPATLPTLDDSIRSLYNAIVS